MLPKLGLRTIGFILLWLGLVIYAFGFAPPDQPDTFDLIVKLSTGDWEGINPLIIALFNLMGVWPMIYAAVLLSDGQGQKIPAFPFVLGSFALGAFALLPYLALRQPNPQFNGEKSHILKGLESRGLGVVLSLVALVLLGFGLTQGNWGDFVQQWQTSRFIHVMSLDFCLLWGLFSAVLGDDMARRGLKDQKFLFWAVTLIPLLGALGYLVVRSPLPEATDSTQEKTN